MDADKRDFELVPEALPAFTDCDGRAQSLPRKRELDARWSQFGESCGPVRLRDFYYFDILPTSIEMLPNGRVHDREGVVFPGVPVKDHDLHAWLGRLADRFASVVRVPSFRGTTPRGLGGRPSKDRRESVRQDLF